MKLLLYDFIKRETGPVKPAFFMTSAISGIANAGILAIINNAAMQVADSTDNFRYLLMFAFALAIYAVALKWNLNHANRLFEAAIHSVRSRLSKKISRIDLNHMDTLGSSTIYNTLTQETALISQTQGLIVSSLQAGIMVMFVALYIASVSMVAFVITIITVWLGVMIYFRNQTEMSRLMHESINSQVRLFGMISELVAGFKELKVNNRKADDFQEDLDKHSQELSDLTVET